MAMDAAIGPHLPSLQTDQIAKTSEHALQKPYVWMMVRDAAEHQGWQQSQDLAFGSFLKGRAAVEPCGTRRCDQSKRRNIFRVCRPAPKIYETTLAPRLHEELPMRSSKDLAATPIVQVPEKYA